MNDKPQEARITKGPGARFRFTPAYLEKMGGPIVAVEPQPEPAADQSQESEGEAGQ